LRRSLSSHKWRSAMLFVASLPWFAIARPTTPIATALDTADMLELWSLFDPTSFSDQTINSRLSCERTLTMLAEGPNWKSILPGCSSGAYTSDAANAWSYKGCSGPISQYNCFNATAVPGNILHADDDLETSKSYALTYDFSLGPVAKPTATFSVDYTLKSSSKGCAVRRHGTDFKGSTFALLGTMAGFMFENKGIKSLSCKKAKVSWWSC